MAARANALAETHSKVLDELESSEANAEEIRVRLWEDVYRVYRDVAEFGESWNDLASDLGAAR